VSGPAPVGEPRLLPAGPRALLVELAGIAAVVDLAAAIRDAAVPGVVDVVPAARTVLVVHDGRAETAASVERVVRERPALPAAVLARPHAGDVVIGVTYDGADLADVARRCSLSVEEVVARHTAGTYTAAFCGFVAGFSYLLGLDPRLHLPRRSSPRERVPAGSVAIASGFSAVYPTASPGGWHLLGTTDAELWDERRDPPALLPPGTTVRFERVRAAQRARTGPAAAPGRATGDPAVAHGPVDAVVRAWGVAGSVRDGGRPGWAHLGRSRGGALDAAALALANRLVGNAGSAAGFESSGGLVVELRRAAMVAVAGAAAEITVEHGPAIGWGAPVVVPAGATIRVGRLLGGMRLYLAVRGGISGRAPTPREADGAVAVAFGADPATPAAGQPAAPEAAADEVSVWPGPRLERFAPGAWDALLGTTWTVSAAGDRVGVRLTGSARLRHLDLPELAPEGLVEGAVQVPPDGSPIVMLADHPVTGGYPVIAVVDPDHVARVVQHPPGSTLRFRARRPARR